MLNTKMKISRITEAIMRYLLDCDINDCTIHYKEENDRFKVEFDCVLDNIDVKWVDDLKKQFEHLKHREISTYYCDLIGTCDDRNDLEIVGMMLDDYTLSIQDNNLKLTIYRFK